MLTAAKKREIKKILKQVNVSEICKELNVNRVSVWKTLKGDGKMYNGLVKVVERAKEKIAAQKNKIESL